MKSQAVHDHVEGAARISRPGAVAEEDTGLPAEQGMEVHGNAMHSLLSGGAFPTFAGILEDLDAEVDLDTLFEFGLARMLDGPATLLEKKSTRPFESS